MTKSDLLKQIADDGYNAGYGAKVSFASFDMLRLLPGIISFSSTALGVLGLVFDSLSTKGVSAGIMVIGLVSYYINAKDADLRKFEQSGKELTEIRNKLGLLYGKVKASNSTDMSSFITELGALQNDIGQATMSKQLIFSGWYGHFKFFGEAQIGWIDEELKFKFWKDKVPATFKAVLFLVIIVALACAPYRCMLTKAGSPKDSPPEQESSSTVR